MALNFVQGDTAPQIQLTLTDEITTNAINLTGATVNFNWRAVNTTTPTYTREATILSPSTGVCTVVWAAEDLQLAPGAYEAEVEVVYSSGIRETVYDLIPFTVRADIA